MPKAHSGIEGRPDTLHGVPVFCADQIVDARPHRLSYGVALGGVEGVGGVGRVVGVVRVVGVAGVVGVVRAER